MGLSYIACSVFQMKMKQKRDSRCHDCLQYHTHICIIHVSLSLYCTSSYYTLDYECISSSKD